MSNKRNVKNKHLAPSQDFFALGGSTSTSATSSLTQGLSKLPSKRNEPFQAPMSMSPKRPKLNSPLPQAVPGTYPPPETASAFKPVILQNSNASKSWEERAIVVPATELNQQILQYDKSFSEEMIDRLLCGAVLQLRSQRTKPDSCLVFTLIYLAKIRPLFFCSTPIVDAFSSLLKRESLPQFKSKNPTVPILVINLFYYAFHDENSWPETFIKMYIEDSLGDRVWVDNEECKEFVDIIIASFKTKLPPKSLLQTSDILNPNKQSESGSLSLNLISSIGDDSMGDDGSCSSNPSIYSDQSKEGTVATSIASRYSEVEQSVISYVTDAINEHLNRRQATGDISRNTIKLLMATSGIRNVRLSVAQKLDTWYQNPKISRPAQDLLLTIFLNCTENDEDILNYLMKMRIKNKAFVNHFIVCLKELLKQQNATFDIVLRAVLRNELAQCRNWNNYQLMAIIFQQNPDRATVVLAKVFLKMIFTKDDFLRALRIMMREIVRVLRYENLNYGIFVNTLFEDLKYFSEKVDIVPNEDRAIKERAVQSIIDLITMTILLSINPSVREAFSTTKSDRREIIRNFQLQIATIQCRAVKWLFEPIIRRYCSDRIIYCHCLKLVLFQEPSEQYCKIDNWPSENDRNFVFRITSEVPLFEETLLCILSMGFAKEIPLSQNETCEISFNLINRAAMIYDGDIKSPVLLFKDPSIIQMLFDSAAYCYPETAFPENYIPPKLAINDLYLKVWMQIIILAAHLPQTFGKFAWNNYPTFRMFVEMTITNNYQYPPKTSGEDLLNKDLLFAQIEKVKILEFENFLAVGHEITEANSYLLSTLTMLDPFSIPRRPSNQFLEQLNTMCSHLHLCHLMCQSRDPDFLLMIIEQQQNCLGSQTFQTSMAWLVDLVESNENNFAMLPVQCLCEFLLGQVAEELLPVPNATQEVSKSEKSRKKEKRRKLIRLINYFQKSIEQSSPENLCELVEYLIRRLSYSQLITRLLAYKALHLIVATNTEEYLSKLEENIIPPLLPAQTTDWLQTKLFKYFKSEYQIEKICQAFENALFVETNPVFICDYFDSIAKHVLLPNEKLVHNCCTLLVHRKKIASHILSYSSDQTMKSKFLLSLYKILFLYTEKLAVLEFKRKPDDWKFIKFSDVNRLVPIHPFIVHGIILSLSYCDIVRSEFVTKLTKRFLSEPYPQIFNDFEQKEQQPLISEQLSLRLLCSQSEAIINLVLANVKNENIITFLDYYGLSRTAVQKILQTLDKSRIKNLKFDQTKLLNTFQVYWMKGIQGGHKFAKFHLGYKGETTETNDVEMSSISIKKEEKPTFEQKTYIKPDIKKLILASDSEQLVFLSRQIAIELNDSSNKSKSLTKSFLSEFNSSIGDIRPSLVAGHFNSIFNMIIVMVLKDEKRFGLNTNFQAIKKSLLSLSSSSNKIEDSSFWKYFERLFYKDAPKAKKTKQTKKKNGEAMKSHEDLELFLKKFNFSSASKMLNQEWSEIFKDLAIEKFYKKDTELADLNASLMPMIFSRNRPHFLALLLHKSNFSTLRNCIVYILSDKESIGDSFQLNPTAILNFLTICINSPKLWIGRDMDSQKTTKSEDVLQLNGQQIKKLIDYVILENDIPNRVNLVLESCCVTDSKIALVTHILFNYKDEVNDRIVKELHIRLYLHIPRIGLPPDLDDANIKLIHSQPSFIDKITHNLITSFMFSEPNSPQVNGQLFRYWELSLLKVASRHPLLLIRQLPMIPALLSDKVNLVNYEAFKSLNLMAIFRKLFNVLKLLLPYLWNKNTKGVADILDLYMNIFITYYHIPRQKEPNNEILPLLIQFINLIDNWIKHDADAANNWIKHYKHNFTELSMVYHSEQHHIKSIVAGLPVQNENKIMQNSQMFLSKLRSINIDQESLLSTLAEISKLSQIHPELPESLLDEIRTLYTNPFTCEYASNLSLKALQNNPNLSKSLISTYLKCFESNINELANIALGFLPEFVILAKEYRYLILQRAFHMAVMGNLNAVSALISSFKAINSQIGC